MKTAFRIGLAILVGVVFPTLISGIINEGIDLTTPDRAPHVVTFGTHQIYTYSLSNIIYFVILGFLMGFLSGGIAKVRGWLVGIFTVALFYIIGAAEYYFFVVMKSHGITAGQDDVMVILSQFKILFVVILFVFAALGGYIGEGLRNDPQFASQFENIRWWHWLWLWIPLTIYVYYMSGSIRFLIAGFIMGWEIIFIPSLWVLGFFAGGIITGLLYMSFSIPLENAFRLISVFGEADPVKKLRGWKLLGFASYATLAVPAICILIGTINIYILNYMVARGLKVP